MHEFTVSVAEVLGRPGTYRDIRLSAPLPGVRTKLARLGDAPVRGDLRAESVVEGILVTGRAEAPVVATCARCLRDVQTAASPELCELFVAPGTQVAPDEDVYEIRGTDIDLEPALRDALTLALPLNPLCREDCKGICARCGADLNATSCDCSDDDVDPRWAILDAVRAELER
ncbi:MAG TPA: DUF177 domain-containing protein [Actinomycetota bacterium]|nr:DUF177 domain-containing protein [Actinomycetota bacterium]